MIVNFHAPYPQELPVLAKSILLVEDSPLYQKQITDAIIEACPGGLVTVCSTGAEALEMLGKKSTPCFDLVLVDLGLPDISGIAVIRAARQRFSKVPIMVISTISTESSLIESIRAGARGYILKRDAGIAMSNAIQSVLQGNYPISPSLAHSLFKMAGAPGDAKVTDSFKLSRRETETLLHISRGQSYAEVAKLMGIGLSSVQSNIRILYRKLEVNTQMQAVVKARHAGLI